MKPERTRAERRGYHRGWKKRMHVPMQRAIARLEDKRQELLSDAAALATAIRTMQRMMELRIDDVEGR